MNNQTESIAAYVDQNIVEPVIQPAGYYGVKIKECTVDDVDHLHAFQSMIYDFLHEDEKGFFLPKTKSFLTDHFNAGSQAIMVIHDGQVVGQALIVLPTVQRPKTGMTDMDLPAPLESLSIIQGLSVHPKARGLNIGNILIQAWLQVSEDEGRDNVLAETSQDNLYSWALFNKNDVPIVSEGVDLTDGTALYNHHCSLKTGRKLSCI